MTLISRPASARAAFSRILLESPIKGKKSTINPRKSTIKARIADKPKKTADKRLRIADKPSKIADKIPHRFSFISKLILN